MESKVFGCKVNKFYLNKWLAYFQQHDFSGDDKVLVASCVVTDRAKSKWVKDVKKRLQNGKKVYLTGCGAFAKGKAMDYDSFFGIYPTLQPYKNSLFLLGEDPQDYHEHLDIGGYELNAEIDQETVMDVTRYTKKFIVIQSGCDTFCTFCLTIHKRGSNRNRSAEDILEEINEFVRLGGKEIVITGVNLATRGATHTRKPDENRFADLLEKIIKRTAIERIRISSLGPDFLTEQFFDVVSDRRFLPHFHFSVQSFSDTVLRLMNRNYDSAVLDRVLTQIQKLTRADRDHISIGADIIVGFPGETEEEFLKTFHALDRYGITKLHAFPFSPHQKGETVPAGKLPGQVPQEIKKQRERKLLAEGDRVRKAFIDSMQGEHSTALLESYKDGKRHGRSENYIQVATEGDYQRGDVVSVVL